jgi:hypothetical protein
MRSVLLELNQYMAIYTFYWQYQIHQTYDQILNTQQYIFVYLLLLTLLDFLLD